MTHRFPPEEAGALLAALTHRYAEHLGSEQFEVSGGVEPGWVELRVALADRSGTFRYAMEFRVETAARGLPEKAAKDLLADFAGQYLDRYFEGGRDLLLPLDFQPYEFADRTVFARGDVTNPALDRMADEILEAGVPLADDDPRRTPRRPR